MGTILALRSAFAPPARTCFPLWTRTRRGHCVPGDAFLSRTCTLANPARGLQPPGHGCGQQQYRDCPRALA
ncbi:hypothetical protein B0H13DRAFT_2008375 [Mycena leptocephala]|nr:hypothetical protein B0H13DRAFT_2008309 [Mycena leptocephala]KAJ7912052.1 hypothetical protein B0H13DRAFT_2008375 [Mycena leptocephala]